LKKRIGIIGLGNIGCEHIKGFLRMRDEVEIVAVCDIDLEIAKACAEEFGIKCVCADAEELFAMDEIGAVVVAVPNRFHASLAIAAMDTGKHVLLEKPMGINLADARVIYDRQQSSGLIVMICHQMRWMWWAQAMRKRIAAGDLGHIYHAKAGWRRRKGIPGWGTWFTQMAESGGGPLVDIAVHMLDISLHLMGNPKPLSVSGVTASVFGKERRGIGTWGKPDWAGHFDVEDFASAFVRLEGNRTLSLDVSWAAHVDRPKDYVELLGVDGGLNYYGGELKFLTERDGEVIDEIRTDGNADERVAMNREFLAAIDGGQPPECDAYSGLVTCSVLDAIYRSAKSGSEIVLNNETL